MPFASQTRPKIWPIHPGAPPWSRCTNCTPLSVRMVWNRLDQHAQEGRRGGAFVASGKMAGIGSPSSAKMILLAANWTIFRVLLRRMRGDPATWRVIALP